MKKLGFIVLAITVLVSCHKVVEKKAQDAIMKVMTDGQWVVTNFTSNGNNITTDFSGYSFQFFDDYTVKAMKNGTLENSGTFVGDFSAMTISSNFPNAVNPLLLLNGTWHITNTSDTYVIANMTIGTEVRTIRLDKQ
jgi:hypothetical protein